MNILFIQAKANVREVYFLPFNYVDIDPNGNWHRASKGVPEQILALCNAKEDLKEGVHSIIDRFAKRGFRSLGVTRQC